MVKSHDGVGDEYSTKLQALAGFPRWLCMDVCLTNDLSHTLKIKMCFDYPSLRLVFVRLKAKLICFVSLSPSEMFNIMKKYLMINDDFININ